MHKQITSLQNPSIKELVFLKEKSRIRKNTGRFLLEGKKEITLAVKGNYDIINVLLCPDICKDKELIAIKELIPKKTPFVEISKNIYKKISYRETTEGITAVVNSKTHSLDSIVFKRKKPLILVAESPEKPGNIGAMLRTSDAANIDAILIADPKTDLYNPNIIRNSLGCLFTTQIAVGSTKEILDYLNKHKITSYAATLEKDSEPYQKQNFSSASAIVVGNESIGLSDKWLKNSSKKISIHMKGKIDSMNVSVVTAILIFEAIRQRGFK